MNPFQSNPFTILSLIAAPAVLTNASSVLALGTSNRFARAIDRSRALLAELEGLDVENDPKSLLRIRQMDRTETRCLLLLRSLRSFYLALGCFAATSLISVLGAGIAGVVAHWVFISLLGVALSAGTLGVGSLVYGCSLLIRDTQLAVQNVHEEAALLRERYKGYLGGGEGVK